MKKLLSDLRYLLGLLGKRCSFGVVDDTFKSPEKQRRVFADLTNLAEALPTIPKSVPKSGKIIKAVPTDIIHTICEIPIRIYYYPSYTKGKEQLVYTPLERHTTKSSNIEGPHHPICKIELEQFKDFIITEDNVKYKGTEVVVDDSLNCKDQGKLGNGCNYSLLLAMIVANYYSLSERFLYYLELLEKHGPSVIDYGHAEAYKYNIAKIENIIELIVSKKTKECAKNFLNTVRPLNLPFLKIMFEEIDKLSHDQLKERLDYIFEVYDMKLNHRNFLVLKSPEYKSMMTPIKPKRLF
jgi:hypothetical protein